MGLFSKYRTEKSSSSSSGADYGVKSVTLPTVSTSKKNGKKISGGYHSYEASSQGAWTREDYINYVLKYTIGLNVTEPIIRGVVNGIYQNNTEIDPATMLRDVKRRLS